MNTITFTEEKITYKLAGSFNELTRNQLVKLAGIININIYERTKKHLIVRTLLNVGSNPFTTFLFRFKIKPGHIVDMFPAAEWALKEPDLTKQLLPSFRIPWSFKKLYGPEDHMKNIVFIEFIKAENNYTLFRKTGKVEYLDKLIAILYRPKKKDYNPDSSESDGDIREKYNDFNYHSRAKKLKGLDIKVKLAIMMYFYGCRKFIVERKAYCHVFTKEEHSKVQKSEGKYTWEDVLIDMAGHVQYIDNVSFSQLYTVLRLINDKIRRDKETIADIKKRK